MTDRGRPKVFDEKQRELACGLIRMGCTREQAATQVGIGVRTLFKAMKEDKEFAARVRAARVEKQILPLNRLVEQSRTSWRAAAWLLERQDPRRFGRRAPGTMTEADVFQLFSSMMMFVMDGLRSPEDFERVLDKLRELATSFHKRNQVSPRVVRALKRASLRTDMDWLQRHIKPEGASDANNGSPHDSRTAKNAETEAEKPENALFEHGSGI